MSIQLPTERLPDPSLDTGGDSGGNPTTPPVSGTNPGSNPSLIPASGALFGMRPLLLVPLRDANRNIIYIAELDPLNLDCEEDFEYQYRAEEFLEGRQITTSRVRIIYKDIGICKITVTIDGATVDKTKNYRELTIGSVNATGKLVTTYADLVVTTERPQIIITRKANAGPLRIIKATMVVEVEQGQQV